jgi:hypothetical protein
VSVVERAAARAVTEAAARVAEGVRDAAPALAVTVEGGDVVVTGRGLWRIAALRWIGGLVR